MLPISFVSLHSRKFLLLLSSFSCMISFWIDLLLFLFHFSSPGKFVESFVGSIKFEFLLVNLVKYTVVPSAVVAGKPK